MQPVPLPRPATQSDDALRESYRMLADIFADTEDRVFVKDADGRYLMVNSAAAAYFGRQQNEVVGRTDWELLPPEVARGFVESDQRVLRSGESVSYEVEALHDGPRTWVYTTKAPVRDPEGRIVGIIGVGRDISGRKKAEEALRLSEAHVARAQAIAHLGSWEWNLKTNEVTWSTECYRIFGVDPARFRPTYARIARHIDPASTDYFRETLAAAVRHGTEFKDDFRILRPSGEERYVHIEGVVTQRAADGSPLIMTGTNHDITERKQTELALRRSEATFAHAQRIAQVGSWEWTPATGRRVWSTEAARIFGVEPHSDIPLLREDFLAMVHPEDRAAVSAAVDVMLTDARPLDIIYRIVRGDGAERLIHAMGELRKDDGLLPTMIGVCRDITEQRRLHAQLIRSEATLAQAQRIARLASWRWDLRSGNESWSNEILEILGFDRTDGAMTFRRLLEFVHPDDRSAVSAAFNSTLAGAAPYALDFRVFDNNGRMRYIHSLGEAIRDPDGSTTSVIGILQDITERKLIEEELAASRDELRNLTDYLQHLQEDERRRIAREIHDEFGAVFTAANLSLYRLASLFQQAPPAARELLASTKEMIANAGKALDDIVNGLHPQMLTHLGLVATMHWYLDEFARRTGLQCTRNLPHEDLVLDEKLTLTLFRCLQESLTNVAKHAQAKNVHVEFAVRAKQLTLTTSDDGCGVAPSALSAADVFGIRGLQERVARLGGTLRMVDNRPRGTRVSVTLPTNAR